MGSKVTEKEEMMLREESPLRDLPWEENYRNKDKNVLLQCGSENWGKKRDLSSPVIKILISGQN